MESIIPSILIVDDDADNLILISKMLEKSFSDISIYSASSGFAGIKLAKKYLPDTIILDVMMPDIDGFAVCKELKEDSLTKNIPILMITGLEIQMQAKIKALNIGADSFLSKPIRKAELIAQIKAMLRIKIAEDKVLNEKKKLERLIKIRTKKLHLLAAHTLSLQEEERARISRGLHDELGQMLVGLQMGHDSLLKIIGKKEFNCSEKEILLKKTRELIEMTEYSFDSVRKIVHDLRPPVLDHLGLIPAIEWLAQDFYKKSEIKIKVKNMIEEKLSFSKEQNTSIFRILQESLTNIAKHSKGTDVLIQIKKDPKLGVKFEIEDNGCGIEKEKIDSMKNFGVMGMHERATQFDWILSIDGQPGIGTKVTLITV